MLREDADDANQDFKEINKCINPTSVLTAEQLDGLLFALAEILQLNDLLVPVL